MPLIKFMKGENLFFTFEVVTLEAKYNRQCDCFINIMAKRYLLPALIFLVTHQLFAQLPEQDCISAIPVCQSSYFQPISYVNYGNQQELTYGLGGNSSCLRSEEHTSELQSRVD